MKKLAEMTDEQLALCYVDGNNEAFDELLSRNQSKIFAYIMFVVRDEDMANDIFQETFVKIIVKLQHGKYAPTGKFGAWCMRIAHNVIMDWYRDHSAERTVEMPEENNLENIGSGEMLVGNIEGRFVNEQIMNDIRHMMAKLPASQREVVYMRFYQEMSFKEIAETTSVSINTALGRMRYAVLNMRRMAKTYGMTLQLSI